MLYLCLKCDLFDFFYNTTRKERSFNTGDRLIYVTTLPRFTVYEINVVKEHRLKMFRQHPGCYKAVLLKKTNNYTKF